ncbi:hypothetical protein ACFL6X_09210 [Candidatus Latescibacterota bacterium]
MALTIIPLTMPEPAEIPSHLVQAMEQALPDEAVRQGWTCCSPCPTAPLGPWVLSP